MSCRSRLATLNEKLTALERRIEYIEARVSECDVTRPGLIRLPRLNFSPGCKLITDTPQNLPQYHTGCFHTYTFSFFSPPESARAWDLFSVHIYFIISSAGQMKEGF